MHRSARLLRLIRARRHRQPLLFTDDELDAVLLELRLAHRREDDMADAADGALAKITLPET